MVVYYDLLAIDTAFEPVARNDYLCYCLRVTEDDVREAVTQQGVSSVGQLMCETGAGSGCTACHLRLRAAIARHSVAVSEEAPAA